MRRRRAALRGLALVLAALPLMSAAPVSRLDIGIDQMRSAKGMIRLCLTADPDNFPACVDDARAMTRSVPAGQKALHLDGLPHGDYAAAVIHDENGNAKLDTLAGIPREGFGFSRNPAIRFGPPRFTAARFTLDSVAETQQIRMRYIF
ncbi:DUF2141 domain-containing protein [Sphingomonas sanguinis]|jgi:uncharacterized protein (DUF2141 family)|uniref:DUF2141 domain-containing protein n=1 Tax=Sphingomonas sp. LC-1 TaxID=3110957 RepID=UPI0021BA4EA7|nr:DUF2141 domain-containing protein [Sphingomonas sp. LC-1]MCT8002849.1 DUF2141 domain-containing protein [Sphingomonas sp. LC-1]